MARRKITVPFLDNKTIKEKADSFRKKLWNDSVPVDIESIIELKLKMDIIPVIRLQKECDTDALIASNWRSIYVDKDRYLSECYQEQIEVFFCS